ncbi:MAG: tRNA (adenosine(37)-N6)-threonylcarbamoyltransferase complex ATPase subunit type 1 TsaE [Candidatus Krumholzibacteriia bacterium]
MSDQPLPSPAEFPRRCVTDGVADTRALGARVAGRLRGGDVLLLHGDLGAGKTSLVQGICAALGVADEVVSPTFTLVHRYASDPPIYHLDFYRLDAGADLGDVGVEAILDEVDAGEAVLVVEWPAPIRPLVRRCLEMLAVMGPGPEQRVWHLRGVPELPSGWDDLAGPAAATGEEAPPC